MIIPDTLANYRQFILYIVRPSRTRPGKTDKFPINPFTGEVATAHDPTTHMTGADALAALASGVGDGVGFSFTENDPFFFIDIDNALTAAGTWTPLAVDLCQQFAGCFIEVSVSGKGLHIIGTGGVPAHSTAYKNDADDMQLYTSKRFCALTGISAYGSAGTVAQSQLTALVAKYFTPTTTGPSAEWTTGPSAEWTGPTDDDELINRMLASKQSVGSIFGGKASIMDLWTCNQQALGQAFPDDRPEGFDRSSADAALCAHLAFWTGKDCERMDRLIRLSGLYRDKWENRPDYRQTTIIKAITHCKNVYSVVQPVAPVSDPEGLREGYQYMTVIGQQDHFNGCVYVRAEDAIFVPDGALLKPGQFKATFGGFDFIMDIQGDKVTKSAWEAFTESRAYVFPKAHDLCFRPECPPGAIINEEDGSLVNIYVPITTPRMKGDPTPWLNHLAKLFPNSVDRAIIDAYLAALVQYPGKKFYWCPVIQGCQGNGKTLINTVVSHAVGQRYTHLPNPDDISNKFNAWIVGKLFVAIEEAYVADRQELISALKILIGNERVDIQGKGENQRTGDNRANFILCSNHKDVVRLSDDDRRFSVFFTAQQDKRDLLRDGMSGDYFPNLYDWLKREGYAIVNDYLRSYQIPDHLNPATHCHRAPETSSTAEALRVSMGSIEQEVMESIDEGRIGFCGGWVSSQALEDLLIEKRLVTRMPRNRRKELMNTLGYDLHPGLKDGRVMNAIVENGRAHKPRLFIRYGHESTGVLSPVEIVRMYQEAQKESLSLASAIFS